MAWLAGVCGFCAVSEQSQAVDPILLRSGRHRIEPLCSVPHEDYQFGSRTQSLVVRSLAAVPHYSFETTEEKNHGSETARKCGGSKYICVIGDATDQLEHRNGTS